MITNNALVRAFADAGYVIEEPEKQHPNEIAKILHPLQGNKLLLWVRKDQLLIFPIFPEEGVEPVTITNNNIQLADYKGADNKVGIGILDRATGKRYDFNNIKRGASCAVCGSTNLIDEVSSSGIFIVCPDCGHSQST